LLDVQCAADKFTAALKKFADDDKEHMVSDFCLFAVAFSFSYLFRWSTLAGERGQLVLCIKTLHQLYLFIWVYQTFFQIFLL